MRGQERQQAQNHSKNSNAGGHGASLTARSPALTPDPWCPLEWTRGAQDMALTAHQQSALYYPGARCGSHTSDPNAPATSSGDIYFPGELSFSRFRERKGQKEERWNVECFMHWDTLCTEVKFFFPLDLLGLLS